MLLVLVDDIINYTDLLLAANIQVSFHPVDQSLKCKITIGGLSWNEMNNIW